MMPVSRAKLAAVAAALLVAGIPSPAAAQSERRTSESDPDPYVYTAPVAPTTTIQRYYERYGIQVSGKELDTGVITGVGSLSAPAPAPSSTPAAQSAPARPDQSAPARTTQPAPARTIQPAAPASRRAGERTPAGWVLPLLAASGAALLAGAARVARRAPSLPVLAAASTPSTPAGTA